MIDPGNVLSGQTLCNKNAEIPDDIIIPNFTFTSSLGVPGFTGQKILVEGTIIVNTPDFFFRDCKIEFLPGARMIIFFVNSSITGSELYACDEMWQGITVFSDSNLTFSDSKIEDALNAVEARNRSSQQITNVVFNRNNVGYRIRPLSNFQRISLDAFQGNTFIGGQLNSGSTGFAGMWIENVSFLNTGSGQGTINNFRNLDAGIISKNSNLNVRDCSFLNIEKAADRDGFQTGIAIQSHGASSRLIVRGQGAQTTSPPLAENCSLGVFASQTTLFVSQSLFRNISSGIDIRRSQNRFFNVSYNRLELATFAGSGVKITESTPSYFGFVQNNKIIGENFITAINAAGNNLSARLFIEKNTITGNSAAAGIDIHNQSGLVVNDNDVTMNGSVNSGLLHILRNKSDGQINTNVLLAGSASAFRAANIEHSTNLTYECNQTFNSGVGFRFNGGCNNSDFIGSSFNDHSAGLRLTANSTVIDDQEWNGNTWLLSANYSPAAEHLGTNFQQSIFKVNVYDECDGGLSVWPPSTFPLSGWFEPENNELNSKRCCDPANAPPISKNLSSVDLQIATGTYENYMNEEVATWDGELYLFARLVENSALIEPGSVYESFYQQNLNSEIGIFHTLRAQIQAILSLSEEQSDELEALNVVIEIKADSVHILDSLILLALENGEPIEAFTGSKSELLIDLSDLDSLGNLVWNEFEATKTIGINEIYSTIEGLSPEKDYQQYELDMWEIYLEWSENDFELTVEQENYIQTLAGLCPYKYGTAVYMARSYYPTCEQHEFDDETICSVEGRILPSLGNTSIKVNSSVEIHPNPATSEFFVLFPKGEKSESGSLTIFNTTGQKVTTFAIESDNQRYNISELSSGVYFIKIERENFAPVLIKQIIR